MSKKPKTSAFSIVTKDEGRSLLLTKRKDVPVWVLPGGGVEPDESPEKAAWREVLEETGITVKIIRCSGHYFPINRLSHETYVYEATAIHGELKLSDETSEIAYFPLNALPKALFLVHRDWISDWQNSGGATITKHLSQVTYWNMVKYLFKHPLIFLQFLGTRIKLFFGG
jgi:ADP-ribose pyrophosphatase YjhB (NUDIX family)